MGLFDKKECAICGGKVKGLFPWQVDGQYICNGCYGLTHIQPEIFDGMTLEEYKKYIAFREENQKLKDKFGATKKFDFGFLMNKPAFDEDDGLFCLHADLSTTIFEAAQMEGFTIFEDGVPLFESSPEGLKQYASFVPDRALQLAPMARHICEETARRKPDDPAPYYDVPEPFRSFNIEIYMKDHPFWQVVKTSKEGPTFSNSHPNVDSYLRDYEQDIEMITDIAHTLMDMLERFGSSAEKPAAAPAAEPAEEPVTEPAPAPEPAEEPEAVEEPAPAPVSALGESETIIEIKRYKELLDAGIITEEEFTAKKKQLMGI